MRKWSSTVIGKMVHTSESPLTFMEQSVAHLSEQQTVEQPPGVPIRGAWTLGHIIVSCQGVVSELGAEQWLPDGVIALPASTLPLPGPSQLHTYFPPFFTARDTACAAA